MRLAVFLLCVTPLFAADRTVKFSSPMYFLPPAKEIVFTKAGEPGPGVRKYAPHCDCGHVKDATKLSEEGP